MRLKSLLSITAAAAIALSASAAGKPNILSIKETITDNDIVFPESFETDVNEMMNNWYLQNYAVLDAEVEHRATGEVSDAEYVKRLKALPTVIEMPYNQVVRSYIDRYVKRNRTLVEEMLGMSLYYMPIFEEALEREQLPMELKYLPVIESALNPNAVSRAGAAGLWQFMVGTGKGLGLEVNSLVDERRDPYRSSTMAAKYLNNLYSIYNDWSLAIAAYNCGPGNVNKALRRAGGENKDFWAIYNYLPRETRGYVPAFIAANYIMTYFKQHNISPSLARKPLITDTVSVTRRVHFGQISHVLNVPMDELRILNPQYRQDVIPGSETRPYTLVLPSQQVYSYIMSEDSIANYSTSTYAHRDVVEPGDNDEGNYTYETRETTSYHKVRKGETVGSIAAKYGMTSQQLLAMNTVKGGKVRRGQVVKVTTHKRVKVYNQQADNDDDDDNETTAATGETAAATGNDDTRLTADAESESDEQAQIDEVRRVEQEAKNSPYKGSKRVDVDVPDKPAKQAKSATAAVDDTPADAKQWRNRNARYTAQSRAAAKTASRESTYKNSRSSKASGKNRHKAVEQAKPTTHTIKRGESLSEIAEKNGVSVDALRKANNISGDKIKAGDNITIPGKNSRGKSADKTVSKGKAKKAKGAAKASGKKSKRRR